MKASLKRDNPETEDCVALPMLGAMSEEMYLLANQIAALGEALSKACEAQMTPALSRQLQLFDGLCQRALTLSRLLRGVGTLLSDGVPDAASHLSALIEEVPFEEDRRRLTQAIGGPATIQKRKEVDRNGELDWF